MPGNDDRGRTVDEATLRYLAGVLAGQPEVSGTSLFPANRQETLVVSVNDEYYPSGVDDVRLELRVYSNGDFHVSYFEDYAGEVRRCRWDRHEQDHSTRDHFHPFPSAGTADAVDREFPTDVTRTLETVVLPWIEDRLGTVWEG